MFARSRAGLRPSIPSSFPERVGGGVARWTGVAVAIAGMATIGAALVPGWRSTLGPLDEVVVPWLAGTASGVLAVAGVVLVLVGRGVAGRRRIAWLVALVALSAATLAHVIGRPLPGAAAVTTSAAALLVWQRRLFVVGPGPARLAQVLRVAAAALCVDALYGLGGLMLHRHGIHPRLTAATAVGEVATRLIGAPGPLTLDGRFGHWFPPSLGVLGVLTVIAVLSVALAPVAPRAGGGDRELIETSALSDRADGDMLDPFVLRRDKSRVFSPDRSAVLGYRYVHGVGLASGDPVGDPAAFGPVLREFLSLCDRFGWRPAIVGVRGDRVSRYEALGLRTLYVGDEAVVPVAGFSLTGRRMRNVRQAVARTRRAGVRTSICRENELSRHLRRELLAVAAAQRGSAREFGFSMTLGDLLSGECSRCLVVVARDATGRPVAFQRYLTCRAGTALSLDVMRRLPAAPNGVNERMIVDVVDWAAERGVTAVSLNFAAFRELLDATADLGGTRGVQAWLIQRLEGRFGIQMDTLRRFNAKFQPVWVPRHLVYRAGGDLPAIGLAALSAEGFLPFDRARQSLPGEPAAGSRPDPRGVVAG